MIVQLKDTEDLVADISTNSTARPSPYEFNEQYFLYTDIKSLFYFEGKMDLHTEIYNYMYFECSMRVDKIDTNIISGIFISFYFQ